MKRLLLATLLLACAPVALAQNTHSSTYGQQDAFTAQEVRVGTVLMVREVTIENDKALNQGTPIGAAVGYALANKKSSRNNRRTARVVDGTLGAVAGTSIGRMASKRYGVEIFVEEQRTRKVYAIVQQMDRLPLPGEQVFLTGRGSKTRVVGIQ